MSDKVSFYNDRTVEEIRRASLRGTLYFPTDANAIWLNGQEVANNVMSEEEATLIREGLLPDLMFDFTAYETAYDIHTELKDYLLIDEFTKEHEGEPLVSAESKTITVLNVEPGARINVSTSKSGWNDNLGKAKKVSEIQREGRWQIKYEHQGSEKGGVSLTVPAGAEVYSISVYTNTDAVHERIDKLVADFKKVMEAAEFPKIRFMYMQEYEALKAAGELDENYLYAIKG